MAKHAAHLDCLEHARTGIRCLVQDESLSSEADAASAARRWAAIGNVVGELSADLGSIALDPSAGDAVLKYNHIFDNRRIISTSTGILMCVGDSFGWCIRLGG